MSAEFTINDTAFDTLEYDATYDEVLTLQLADATGIDAARVRYFVIASSDGAPALTFSPSTGIPTVPTGPVTVTMPADGCHSWIIGCEINEGRDANGRTQREYTKRRGVCIKSSNLELRKWCPGETTEFNVAGWTAEQNAAVDILDAAGGGGGGGGGVPTSRDVIAGAGLTGGGDLSADITLAVGAHADGSITVNANDIQVGVLATDAQHGLRGRGNLHQTANGTDAGFMSAAHYTAVQGATATPAANAIVKYGSGNDLTADFVQIGEQGAFPEQGDIRGDEDFSIYAIKSDTDEVRILEVSESTLILGDQNNDLTPEIRSAVNTGVAFRHGPSLTTYFKPLPSGNCTAPGHIRIDQTSGLPYVWSTTQSAEVALVTTSTAAPAYWEMEFVLGAMTAGAGARYLYPGYNPSTGGETALVRWRSRACRAVRITMANTSSPAGTGTWTASLCTVSGDVATATALALNTGSVREAATTGSVSIADGTNLAFQLTNTATFAYARTVWIIGFESP